MTWRDGEVRLSQCAVCRHKHRGAATCDAFPQGIPADILRNERSHAEPVAGDGGLTLDPIEVDREVFEAMTQLPFPAGEISYSDVEERWPPATRTSRVTLVLALDVVAPRLETEVDPGTGATTLGLRTVADESGGTILPCFTTVVRLEEAFGRGTPYLRLRLESFPDGFGDEITVVVNPGWEHELRLHAE